MKKMNVGTMYDQRDIVLIPFPFTDLSGVKKRPAIILSNSLVQNDAICCLVTSKKSGKSIPLEGNTESGKLPLTSFVKPHRIFSVHQGSIIKKFAQVSKAFHKELVHEINELIKIKEKN